MAANNLNGFDNAQLSMLYASQTQKLIQATEALRKLMEENKALNVADAFENHAGMDGKEVKYLTERSKMTKSIESATEMMKDIDNAQAKLLKGSKEE